MIRWLSLIAWFWFEYKWSERKLQSSVSGLCGIKRRGPKPHYYFLFNCALAKQKRSQIFYRDASTRHQSRLINQRHVKLVWNPSQWFTQLSDVPKLEWQRDVFECLNLMFLNSIFLGDVLRLCNEPFLACYYVSDDLMHRHMCVLYVCIMAGHMFGEK